jgi:hypothetical protein
MQIKKLFIGTLMFFTFSVKAQMLQAVKSTIQSHLSDNKTVTNYMGGLNITDATPNSENKTITVKGTYTHEGFWSNVEKPFVAVVKVVLDELSVEKLCYYKYQSAIDKWELKCTNGATNIKPLPEFSKKF